MTTLTVVRPIHGGRSAVRVADHTHNLSSLLLSLARSHARRRQLTGKETEDCARAFVVGMLGRAGGLPPVTLPGHCFAAWLDECAQTFVASYPRAETQPQDQKPSCPEILHQPGSSLVEHGADRMSGWATGLLSEASPARVKAAIAHLPLLMRELLGRHQFHDLCLQQIAIATARTPNAVEQTLVRARQRLRTLLEEIGLTEPELRAYLVATVPLQIQCLATAGKVMA